MVFSKKRQSRIWIITLIYKYLVINRHLFNKKIDQDTTIKTIVGSGLYDELIFAFTKGDMQHFISFYNHLVDNIDEYYKNIITNDYFRSQVMDTSIAIGFCAEQRLGLSVDVLCTEYRHIMMDYTRSEISHILDIFNIQDIPATFRDKYAIAKD